MTGNTNGSAGSFDYFALDGTIDATTEGFFKDLPAKVNHRLVRFNFSRTGRINSMGVALLLRCFKEIREEKKADITLEGLAPMHDMLFKMTGIFLLASPAGAEGKGGLS
jgi:anti-anti-sigma regulatory factor